MIKHTLKRIRQKWHNDINARIIELCNDLQINTNKSNSNIKLEQTQILNQLVLHNQLLCEDFSNFIRDLFMIINRYKKIRNINSEGIRSGIYYKFILNQNELKKVCDALDVSSRQEWYYLILVWVCSWLFAENPSELTQDSFFNFSFFKTIQEITGGGYDFSDVKDCSDVKKQYLYDDDFMKPGMFVIDGGAFTGDTAELFSDIVGSKGMVYSFEPTESSFNILKEKKLANVQCIQKGLYSTDCNLEFGLMDNAPAANSFNSDFLSTYNQTVTIPVTYLDKFIEDNHIPHVDFIKMDVEGSELEALKGAKNTINTHMPNMAICIYHNLGNDVIDVPIWLVCNFGDIYQFRILHHSKGWGESVIYCIKKDKK